MQLIRHYKASVGSRWGQSRADAEPNRTAPAGRRPAITAAAPGAVQRPMVLDTGTEPRPPWRKLELSLLPALAPRISQWIWPLACCCFLVTLLIPFFLAQIPPVLDYPNHLARALVLASGSHDPTLSRMYAPHWGIIPDLAIDLILPPLLHVLPLYLAGRLVLAASMLFPLCGAVVYSRVLFGRRSYWSLGGVLVAFNAGFLLGFCNFLFGLGFAFLAAAIWIGWREQHPIAAVLCTTLGSMFVFFSHIIALTLLGILILAYEVDTATKRFDRGEPISKKWIAIRTTAIAAVFAPSLILYMPSPLARATGSMAWEPYLFIMKSLLLLTPLMNYSLFLDISTGFTILVFIRLGLTKHWIVIPRSTRIALVFLFMAYAIAPFRLKGGSFFDVRFMLIIGYMLFAGLAETPRLSRGIIVSASVCFLVVFGARIGLLSRVWSEQDAQVAQMRAAVQGVAPGDRVLTAVVTPSEAPIYWRNAPMVRRIDGLWPVNFHIPVLLLTRRHAFSPFFFSNPSQHPIILRAPFDRLATPERVSEPPKYTLLSQHRETLKERTEYPYLRHWHSNFDYVLIVDAGGLPHGARTHIDRLSLLRWTDAAALYRVQSPRASGGKVAIRGDP